MRAVWAWTSGLALSGLLHAAAAVVLVPLYAPDDTPAQLPPETRLDMETVAAPQQDATARDLETEPAAEGEAQGTTLGAGAVPQSDARPVAAQADRQRAVTPEAQRAAGGDPAGTPLALAVPDADRLAATAPEAAALRPTLPEAVATPEPATPPAEALPSAAVEAAPVSADPIEGTRTEATIPAGDPLAAAETARAAVPPLAPDPAQLAESTAPAAEQLLASQPAPEQLAAAPPRPDVAEPAIPPATTLTGAQPEPAVSTASTPPATPAAAVIPAISAAPTLSPDVTVSAALAPAPEPTTNVAATPEALQAAEATGQRTAALTAEGAPLHPSRTNAAQAEEAAPPATSARAALAWQFGDRVVTDPQALATIQAFMEPAALDDAQGVKDDLSSVLTGVDCARLSATFIPETGTLEMRGHIPDPDLQGPILAALQAQVGEGIPVTANLLHLPAPQCGALTRISNVGLPQSTDQFTDARLVGETAHAREYSYTAGQRLQFDLAAPDYDAFVYVDYFNADGDVIHLVPNETIPLEEHAAKSVFGVGKDRPGQPGLRITIGPPFGQEIAVAFAASHRLYEGVRPIVEPATPYLEELQALVVEARAAHDDFKGEWVYFFMTTAPATQ